MNLGNTITEKRIENQYTQEQLAKKLNVTKDTIIHWEDNEVSPTMDELIKLARTLDISLDALFLPKESRVLYNVMKQTDKKLTYQVIIFCIMTLCIFLSILFISLLSENKTLFTAIAVVIGEIINLWALSIYIKKLNE